MSEQTALTTESSIFTYSDAWLRQIAADVLVLAKKQGADACEVAVSEGSGQMVQVRCGELETIEYTRDKGVTVTVYLGQKKGHASSSDLASDALLQTVNQALAIARHTGEDPCSGLAEASLLAREQPNLDLYHPWQIGVAEAEKLAIEAEAAGFAVSPKIQNGEGTSVSTHNHHFVQANSLGFMGGYDSSSHSIGVTVIAEDDDGMQRDYWYHSHRSPTALASAADIGRLAGERALRRLGARSLPTLTTPVIFEAPLATGLLGSFVHAISGGALYRQSSFLLDSLGKAVFPPFVQLREYPHLPCALASSPFDGDGVATRDRVVVADGVVEGYFLGVYSARKLGMQTTGNAGGAHNLCLDPGPYDLDLAAMIKAMGKGLLVTELLGHGINYVTGDYSRGAAGFWIENGEIAYPVDGITIAGQLSTMFADIVAIGNDIHIRGSKQCGSIWIEKMTVAGSD